MTLRHLQQSAGPSYPRHQCLWSMTSCGNPPLHNPSCVSEISRKLCWSTLKCNSQTWVTPLSQGFTNNTSHTWITPHLSQGFSSLNSQTWVTAPLTQGFISGNSQDLSQLLLLKTHRTWVTTSFTQSFISRNTQTWVTAPWNSQTWVTAPLTLGFSSWNSQTWVTAPLTQGFSSSTLKPPTQVPLHNIHYTIHQYYING